jgi:hypothetical protein
MRVCVCVCVCIVLTLFVNRMPRRFRFLKETQFLKTLEATTFVFSICYICFVYSPLTNYVELSTTREATTCAPLGSFSAFYGIMKAPRYAVFSMLPSFHLSLVQIFSYAPCFQTPSVHVPLLLSETTFHTHIEPQAKL